MPTTLTFSVYDGDNGKLPVDFAFRTRTISIYSRDRPADVHSKDIVRLDVVRQSDGTRLSGVFCVDTVGSKSGQLRAHRAHLPELKEGDQVTVDIALASPAECAEWLRTNADPERKAMGMTLNTILSASQDVIDLTRVSKDNFGEARRDRELAEQSRRQGIWFALGGFLLGALLDLGLIEEKFNISLPPFALIVGFAVGAGILLYAHFRWNRRPT